MKPRIITLLVVLGTGIFSIARAESQVEVRGHEAEAIALALQSFKSNQKGTYQGKPVYGNLKHYAVQVERHTRHIEITFVSDQPPLKKNEAGTGGGSIYGWDVTYLISLDGKRILNEHFWR